MMEVPFVAEGMRVRVMNTDWAASVGLVGEVGRIMDAGAYDPKTGQTLVVRWDNPMRDDSTISSCRVNRIGRDER